MGTVTKVRNQEQFGTCYAHATLVSIESLNHIENHRLLELSFIGTIDAADRRL